MTENNSLSSMIKNAMDSKGFSVEKLAKKTLISDHFIEMISEGDFKKLPPRPYMHGYIIKIAEALDIDGKKLWSHYLRDEGLLRSSGKEDKLPENRFIVKGINIKIIASALVAILVIFYFAWQIFFSFNIDRVLSLEEFNDDTIIITNDREIVIRGEVDSGLRLLINDNEISVQPEGGFEESIVLSEGFNNITFTVMGMLGKSDSMTRRVFYETEEGLDNGEETMEEELEEAIE